MRGITVADVLQKVIAGNDYINGGAVASATVGGDYVKVNHVINTSGNIVEMTGILDCKMDDTTYYTT